jgi:hypothetical protein
MVSSWTLTGLADTSGPGSGIERLFFLTTHLHIELLQNLLKPTDGRQPL